MSVKQLHKKWRKQFNESVLTRDKFKCKLCEVSENLDVHHIIDRHEMPNGGYVKENGITLCEIHHKMAEVFHSSNKEKFERGFHPNDLFKLIGSNEETAIEQSKKLT